MVTNRKIKNSVIAVIGGAGFIGSHLVSELLNQNAKKIIVIDNLFLGEKRNLIHFSKQKVKTYIEDAEHLSNIEYIFNKYDIDIVFNLATKALNHSFVSPASAFSVNTNIVINLLELLRKKKFNSLCHFSTSEVYGSYINSSMSESHPINPTTTYAAGKAAADHAVKSYVDMFDIDAFIIRPFNNFGPRQNYVGKLAGVIPITISRIMENKPPIIKGNGEQTREFIYVNDTVKLTLELIKNVKPGECVNLSSDGELSIITLIDKISQHLNYKGDFIFETDRPADVKKHSANNKKLKTLISNYRVTPFDDALKQTINWYIDEFRNYKINKASY